MIPHWAWSFIKPCKSVVCLNSDFSCELVKSLELPIIAADGAANILVDHGIIPDIVIGDLDSVRDDVKSQCHYIYVDDQNSTDFEKAIQYIKEHNLFPGVVMGDGGCFDHVLYNFSVFAPPHVYLSETTIGFMITEGIHNFHLPFNAKISLFGAPFAELITEGLKWNVGKIDFFKCNSCSNRVISDVKIENRRGKAFILIHMNEISDAGSENILRSDVQ